MFKNIKKVDERGVKIRGSVKKWRAANPDKLLFDSHFEWEVWKYLKDNNISSKFQPNVTLQDSMVTEEVTKKGIVPKAQRKIGFTPDFFLEDAGVYLEAKGWETPEFRLRWKMFKSLGFTGYIVKSMDEVKLVIKHIKSNGKNNSKSKE